MDKVNESGDQEIGASEIREFKPDGLKQRLIGAIVLVSLAVIFLPMIFDDPHQEKKNIIIPIPEKPADKIVTFDVPKPPQMEGGENQARQLEIIHDTEQIKASENEHKTSNTRTVSKTDKKNSQPDKLISVKAEKPAPKDNDKAIAVVPVSKKENSHKKNDLPKNLSQAWIVQLGTFGNNANATKLRDKARAQGYSTHTAKVESNGKMLTRVFSGPFINREDAVKVKALLDKKFKVSSIVVKFAG